MGADTALHIVEANDVQVNENVFINCNTGASFFGVNGFTVSKNEFVGLSVGLRTRESSSATSFITENLFYGLDTAVSFLDDDHSDLTIKCNGFVEYNNYAIYSLNTTLADQGNAGEDNGNSFITSSTETNHQLYHEGSPMTFYVSSANSFVLDDENYPFSAVIDAATAEGVCDSAAKRVKAPAFYGKIAKHVNASKLYNCTPNPTSGLVNFNYLIKANATSAKIEVKSILGDKVAEINVELNSTNQSSDLNNLRPAIYFYTLYVDQVPVDSKKLIISK